MLSSATSSSNSSYKPVVGILEAVKEPDKNTGENKRAGHSFDTRNAAIAGARTVDPNITPEFKYYGTTTDSPDGQAGNSGLDKAFSGLHTAGRDGIEKAIENVAVQTFETTASGLKTLDKSGCHSVNISFGVNKARIFSEIAGNQQQVQNLGLQSKDDLIGIINNAFEKGKSRIDAVKNKCKKAAEEFKGIITLASGNERDKNPAGTVDFEENILATVDAKNMLTVGAEKTGQGLAQYSSSTTKGVDFVANGDIIKADEQGNLTNQIEEGTSFAAPKLAGAAAVYKARDNKTPDEIINIFKKNAQPLPNADKQSQGHGYVALGAAAGQRELLGGNSGGEAIA